jgi:hypothetical protein
MVGRPGIATFSFGQKWPSSSVASKNYSRTVLTLDVVRYYGSYVSPKLYKVGSFDRLVAVEPHVC